MQRTGSKASLLTALLPLASLTGDQSQMSSHETCAGSINATSSPAPAAGHTLCGLPDGTTVERPGPALALASRSPQPDAGAALPTSATCGRTGSASSASANLQRSLASRLRELDSGSTKYSLTWKVWTTPAGRQICRLHARARHKLGSDCGLWPTPRAAGGKAGPDYAKIGRSRTGISLPTALGGMPNPTWLGWLMGYPAQWINAACSAMPLFRK